MQTAFLGDLLLSIPLFKRARKLWPEQKLFLVCRKGFGDFFKHTGLVDEIFEIKKGDRASYAKVLTQLRDHKIDHLISPHESWRTVFFCRQIRAKKKITYKKFFKSFFFDDLIERDYRLPDSLRQVSLLSNEDLDLKQKLAHYVQNGLPYQVQEQGLLTAPPDWSSMALREQFISDGKALSQIQQRCGLNELNLKKSVLIFPGSVWATKRWTESGFIEVGKALQAQGHPILVMGGPGEEELSARVAAQIPQAIFMAGKTSIYESALLIAQAALVIGNDSAASHMASMCETPLIALFGPTIIEFGYRPWSAQTYLLETRGLPCRPCGKHGHKVCPIGTHECMKKISASAVIKRAELILRPDPSR